MIRNVRDTVPKLIGTFLVRAVMESMQFELYKQINSKMMMDLMGEPESITKERENLRKTLATLKDA